MPTVRRYVWDPLVRGFHWSLVTLFFANALLTDPEGALHEWVGYAIIALLAVRLIWGFAGPRPARFESFPPSLSAARRHLGEIRRREHVATVSHNPLGALMVYNMLATMILIGVTGYAMTTVWLLDSDWLKAAHETLVNWALVSVALHVGGVVFESRRSGESLVGAMLTGYKTRRSTRK